MNRRPGAIGLLAAQTLLLGLFSGLLIIPASSVFLSAFGAEQLPWTYIAGAVAAMIGTPALTKAVRRWALATIAVPVWGGLCLITLAGWFLMEWNESRWVAALLLVLFPLAILIGFFLVGGQAGRVFNLRQMKERFPRVVLGFPAGFMLAGLLGDLLIGFFGEVQRLLPVAAGVAAGFLAVVMATRRRFPEQLDSVPPSASAVSRVPLRGLVRNRYVAALLGYQMLSQLGSQLVEFLMFERAAARYAGAVELGTFVARFTSVVNLFDLVFLFLVAGWLLRRFGMKAGLSLNPGFVTLLIGIALVAGVGIGIGSTIVFYSILAARILDIAFTDGATRTALNTAYQAVPATDRLAVQATIEGLGVPIAIGLTGVILLVLNQGLGVGAMGITILTLAVGVVWTIAGTFVFRAYRHRLRLGLEQRLLDPVDIDLGDPGTRNAIDRLLADRDDAVVWSALGALGGHPALSDRLAELASTRSGALGEAAFEQLRVTDAARAREVARQLLTGPDPARRLDAFALLAPDDPDLHGPGTAAILAGLDAPDSGTRSAACRAAVASGDPALFERVVERASSRDASTALGALEGAGDRLLTAIDRHLRAAAGEGGEADTRRAVRLLRCLSGTGSKTVVEALIGWVDHPVREAALAVRHALARVTSAGDARLAGLVDDLLRQDASFAARTLAAVEALPTDDRVEMLRRALGDSLESSRQLLLATLLLADDPALIRSTSRRLGSDDDREFAHALETLEVHVSSARARLAVPVLDTRPPLSDRLAKLRQHVPAPEFQLTALLVELVQDPDDEWHQPWLAACAIHAASSLGIPIPEDSRWQTVPIVAETRLWAAGRSTMPPVSEPESTPSGPRLAPA